MIEVGRFDVASIETLFERFKRVLVAMTADSGGNRRRDPLADAAGHGDRDVAGRRRTLVNRDHRLGARNKNGTAVQEHPGSRISSEYPVTWDRLANIPTVWLD
jgi:hypothetical protein